MIESRAVLVLAVDPGTVAVGWAMFAVPSPGARPELAGFGTLRPKGEDFLDRCHDTASRLPGAVGQAPDRIVVERPFLRPEAGQGQSILKLGISAGAILGAFPGIPWALCSGHKTKARADLYARAYGAEAGSEHARDAVSMGHYWISKRGLFT